MTAVPGMTSGMFLELDSDGDGVLSLIDLLDARVGAPGLAREVRVDPAYVGVELGTELQPFNTLLEAARFAAPGGRTATVPTRYTEATRIDVPVRMVAPPMP